MSRRLTWPPRAVHAQSGSSTTSERSGASPAVHIIQLQLHATAGPGSHTSSVQQQQTGWTAAAAGPERAPELDGAAAGVGHGALAQEALVLGLLPHHAAGDVDLLAAHAHLHTVGSSTRKHTHGRVHGRHGRRQQWTAC